MVCVRVCGLTVSIEEGEDVSSGHRGSQQPSSDQALSLALTYHAHNVQPLQILIQLLLQCICERKLANCISCGTANL